MSTIGHGSGGTVTIVKLKQSPPLSIIREQLSEPLVRLMSPLTPSTEEEPLMDGMLRASAAIQVGQVSGSGLHSDDEEIGDDFNWDKLI